MDKKKVRVELFINISPSPSSEELGEEEQEEISIKFINIQPPNQQDQMVKVWAPTCSSWANNICNLISLTEIS